MLPLEFSGAWAVHPDRFQALVASAPDTAAAWGRSSSRGGYELFDDVAIISLEGVLSKAGSWWSGGTSTIETRNDIMAAVADPRVKKIALRIDSPGGTVDGTYELAAEVAAAAKQKPTVAYIQDLGASAAYWAASQASQVFASPTAYVGSIGTYGILIDSSGLAEKMGVKVHIVRAGQFKGMAVPGTPVEKAHLEEAQRLIDARNEFFLQGVAAGRKLTIAKVRGLADGRAHIAAKAKELGLVDAVQTWAQTKAALAVTGSGRSTTAAASAAGPITGNAVQEWQDLVNQVAEERQATGYADNAGRVAQEANRRNPQLRLRMLELVNEQATAKRRR